MVGSPESRLLSDVSRFALQERANNDPCQVEGTTDPPNHPQPKGRGKVQRVQV